MAFRAGMVAVVGKPNVGKSTLMNAMVGQKVSIVSSKPQTTRRRVIGIVQNEGYQIALIDTPGIHEPHTKLARAMVEAARASLADIDVVLYVADASKKPDELDEQIARLAKDAKAPVVVCLNKMDLLKAEFVNDRFETFCKLFGTEDCMMTTATRNHNVSKVLDLLLKYMPEGEALFPEDEYTDQSTRFMVAEIIREKVLLATRQEIPHATAVVVDHWEEMPNGVLHIGASVVVEKQGQRAILIGNKGAFVKKTGTDSRLEIEELLGRKVFLELFVKVKEDWRMNPRMLQELEYLET